ncbi:MAG TPA: hypothetical protein VGG80_07495 [Acidobacteriaceae bacterium]|jgi:hypothetical protein
MSIEEDTQKAKVIQQKLVDKLNQEEGWIEKHPGWVSLGALIALGVIIVLLIKACH